MGTYARYTFMRIALFGLSLAVLYLVGARGLLAAVLAALISAILSFLLLQGMRDDVVRNIAARRNRPRRKNVDESAEDSLL